MYIASNGIKTAVIIAEHDPISPRDPEHYNLGKMVCWHRKQSLGDKHYFESPHEFAESIATEYLDKEDIFQAIKDGKFVDLRFVNQGEHYQLEANVSYTRNNYNWVNLDFNFTKDLKFNDNQDLFAAMEDILSYCGTNELLQLCDQLDKIAIMPLHLYDHSGQSISTGSFVGRAQHAEWDSSQVGYIYMDKETAMKELAMPAETLRIARMWNLADRQPINFKRNISGQYLGFSDVMKNNGYEPVIHADYVRNLYDPKLGSVDNQPLIDEQKFKIGAVYKKDHTLYVFDGYHKDGSFDMKPVATFNPDLKPLTEENWKKRAEEILQGEVVDYDNYLQGGNLWL